MCQKFTEKLGQRKVLLISLRRVTFSRKQRKGDTWPIIRIFSVLRRELLNLSSTVRNVLQLLYTKTHKHKFRSIADQVIQGGSNMTGTDLCVNKSQFVPVIFKTPCTNLYGFLGDENATPETSQKKKIRRLSCTYSEVTKLASKLHILYIYTTCFGLLLVIKR
jgi:hypothetical protein